MLLIFLLFSLIISLKAWRVYSLARHAKRLKISVAKFKILSISLSPESNIVLSVSNYSSTPFSISQLQINIYSSKGILLASQNTPLATSFVAKANSNTPLPLSFTIDAQNIISALKDIGGLTSLAANYLTTGSYGLPITLKGFVVIANYQIPIDESLTV